MKLTVGQLRQIVQEERARLHEGFYPGQFAGMDPVDIVDLVSAAERRGTKIQVSKRDLEHLHAEDAQWVLDSLKEPFSLVSDVSTYRGGRTYENAFCNTWKESLGCLEISWEARLRTLVRLKGPGCYHPGPSHSQDHLNRLFFR